MLLRETTVSRYLDPEHLIGYLNMITSLMCNGDTAVGVSVFSLDKTRKTAELCPQEERTIRGSGNASEVVDQLDALLTGGRLGAATLAAVLDVYLASSGPVDNVKSAQQAIIRDSKASRRYTGRSLTRKTLRRSRIFLRVDQWSETTTHQKWQTCTMQHGKLRTDRCPWFIDWLFQLSYTYISSITTARGCNSYIASSVNTK